MDGIELTHYEVLRISKQLLDDAKDPQSLVKHAYRRALLRHHPDKTAPSLPKTPQQPRGHVPRASSPAFTVDQIAAASAVLADPRRRREYDTALSLARAQGGVAAGHQQSDFQTGIDTLDLDDLAYDEDRSVWYRGCRCGNERGFELAEDDLERVADLGELIVGCHDCSLWLKIHFAVILQDGGGEDHHAAAAL